MCMPVSMRSDAKIMYTCIPGTSMSMSVKSLVLTASSLVVFLYPDAADVINTFAPKVILKGATRIYL